MRKHYGPHALLWYGISLPEEHSDKIEQTVAQHPTSWTDQGAAWFGERGLTGVVLVTHNHVFKPQYGLAIAGTVTIATQGEPEVLDGRFTEKYAVGTSKDYIQAVLRVLDIDAATNTIGWNLASMRA